MISSDKTSTALFQYGDLQIITSSVNLSEDMSTLSTNNDELVLLIYPYDDTVISNTPLCSKYFVFDKNKMSDTISIPEARHLIGKDLIVFLLEIDSEKKNEQFEPLIQQKHREIIKAYVMKNYLEMSKLIGDDDLLGIEIIKELKNAVTIHFADICRMDRFDYRITIR